MEFADSRRSFKRLKCAKSGQSFDTRRTSNIDPKRKFPFGQRLTAHDARADLLRPTEITSLDVGQARSPTPADEARALQQII